MIIFIKNNKFASWIKCNKARFSILFTGIILRVFFGLSANPTINQHDVELDYTHLSYGHFDYAIHFFKTLSLPKIYEYEFHQPPLNAFIQGMVMRFMSLFIHPKKTVARELAIFIKDGTERIASEKLLPYFLELYKYNRILTAIYSIIIFILIYKILLLLFDRYEKKNMMVNISLFTCAIYPGMILNATQYGNDELSYLFIFLSIYLAIKWFIMSVRKNEFKTIILLALSIGFGMMTKISVGMVAIIIAPMMLYKLINPNYDKNDELKVNNYLYKRRINILKQLIIFGIIVFPLGLWYHIRNNIVFGLPLGFVWEPPRNTYLKIDTVKYGIVERFLTYPISRIFSMKTGIYHDSLEYNVWIDLIKTATCDEFVFEDGIIGYLFLTLYILNILFYFASFVFLIILIIKSIMCKKFSLDIYIAIVVYFSALFVYILFNATHQFTCNSNYRYIMYITLAQVMIISLFIHYVIDGKKEVK